VKSALKLNTNSWLIQYLFSLLLNCSTLSANNSVEEIHTVGTVNNVETSYFTQLKICYLMTMFRCPSDIFIASWLFTARWSRWSGNHLVPRVAELVGSCIPIHAHRCLPDPSASFIHLVCHCASLSTTFALSQSMTWFSSMAWSAMADLWVTLQLSNTWDQLISMSRAPSSCKQSRRDQDVRRKSKRCHIFQLCKIRSFYVIIIYTVVQKNEPTLAHYNYDPVQSILIIFSKLFVNDHKSCLAVKFSTSPCICCHYTLWNTMLYFALITLLITKKCANFGSP